MYCTFKLSSSKINNSKVHIHVTFHFQKNPTFLFSLCADKPFLRKLSWVRLGAASGRFRYG